MFQLSNLTPLVKSKKRVGRGGSRGGTSGRGHKGQKARSGHKKVPSIFEGGQMPLTRRLPKRGFNNTLFGTTYTVINLSALEAIFADNDEIKKEQLIEKGLIKKSEKLIKILGDGSLSKKLVIHVDAISGSARKAIEESGGQVHLLKEN